MSARARDIITNTFVDGLNIASPHPHQLDAVSAVALEKKSTLLVQPTASGKTGVMHAAASLLGGVILVIMPTIALAEEQATRAQELEYRGLAVYLNHVSVNQAQKMMQLFESWTKKPHKPTILIACPQDLVKKQWSTLVDILTARNLLSLVVVDELHQVPLSASYRNEFRVLKLSLFCKLSVQDDPAPVLGMTASFTKKLWDEYVEVAGHEFETVLWGDVVRTDVKFYALSKSKGIITVLSEVQQYLEEEGTEGEVIIYTNDRGYAEKRLLDQIRDLMDNILVEIPTKGHCAATLNGTLKSEVKGFTMNWFTGSFDANDEYELPVCRVLCATSAANCGLNNRKLKLCIYMGFPECMCSLLQTLGRAGRVPVVAGTLPYKFIIIMSVVHLLFLVKRIQRVVAAKNRNNLMQDLYEVLGFLLLPTQCFQSQLREYFSQPNKRKRGEEQDSSSGDSHGRAPRRLGAGTNPHQFHDDDHHDDDDDDEQQQQQQQDGADNCGCCPFCTRNIPINKQWLKNILFSEFTKQKVMAPSTLVDQIWKNKTALNTIFCATSVTKGECEHLVMQLIAAKILQFKITKHPNHKKGANIEDEEYFQGNIDVVIELGYTTLPNNHILDTRVNIREDKFWEGIQTQ